MVFHVKGWGPKSSVCPSKSRESNFFGRISRDFAGISRKRPKSLRKKSLGSILAPTKASPRPTQPLFQCRHEERAHKSLQGQHLVRCCQSTDGLLFRGSAGVTAAQTLSTAPRQSEICVKVSVFHTVFDVKFW